MDTAKKAALFSALLFPGWGQIYLKHYKRGLLFVLPILAGTISLAVHIILAGHAIIKAAPFKKGAVQFADVIRVSVMSLEAIDLKFFLIMVIFLLILWLLSIIDAYLLGKKLTSAPTIDAGHESISDRP